jgi:hypothetical protein
MALRAGRVASVVGVSEHAPGVGVGGVEGVGVGVGVGVEGEGVEGPPSGLPDGSPSRRMTPPHASAEVASAKPKEPRRR